MVNYRYLGYGITNEQGIATLDHDANGDPITHSYTGTGAGELDIIASLDDSTKISDSSIQSEPYTVWDTLFFDECTSLTDISSRYDITSANTNVSLDESGTGIVVERTSTASSWIEVKINNSTSWRDSNTDYCIEVDVKFERIGSSSGGFILFGGASIGDHTLGNVGNMNHLKLITDGDTLMPYLNGEHISAQDKTMSSNQGFRLQCYQQLRITFKNLKIYRI